MLDIKNKKQLLREYAKSIRRDYVNSIVQIELESRLLQAFQKLYFETELFFTHSKVALFYPLIEEISPLGIIKWLNENNHITMLPIIESNVEYLKFCHYKVGDMLNEGSFKVQEPLIKEIAIPDIIIVPLLAFDKKGNRLGYGRGYYDKTLAYLRKGQTGNRIKYFGMAYAKQELEIIPVDKYDIALDGIITENYYTLFKKDDKGKK